MADTAAKLEANNEVASPLAPNKVAAEVAATQAAMPETAAAIQVGIDTSSLNQKRKDRSQEFANKLTGYINFTPENDRTTFHKSTQLTLFFLVPKTMWTA